MQDFINEQITTIFALAESCGCFWKGVLMMMRREIAGLEVYEGEVQVGHVGFACRHDHIAFSRCFVIWLTHVGLFSEFPLLQRI